MYIDINMKQNLSPVLAEMIPFKSTKAVAITGSDDSEMFLVTVPRSAANASYHIKLVRVWDTPLSGCWTHPNAHSSGMPSQRWLFTYWALPLFTSPHSDGVRLLLCYADMASATDPLTPQLFVVTGCVRGPPAAFRSVFACCALWLTAVTLQGVDAYWYW